MRKVLIALGIAAVASVALTGCNGGQERAESDRLLERYITVDDGREVTCVVYSSGYKGGLSCDWEGAK